MDISIGNLPPKMIFIIAWLFIIILLIIAFITIGIVSPNTFCNTPLDVFTQIDCNTKR